MPQGDGCPPQPLIASAAAPCCLVYLLDSGARYYFNLCWLELSGYINYAANGSYDGQQSFISRAQHGISQPNTRFDLRARINAALPLTRTRDLHAIQDYRTHCW